MIEVLLCHLEKAEEPLFLCSVTGKSAKNLGNQVIVSEPKLD